MDERTAVAVDRCQPKVGTTYAGAGAGGRADDGTESVTSSLVRVTTASASKCWRNRDVDVAE